MIPAIPALVKMAAIFTVIIFAIRQQVALANAFLSGVILLAVFFGLSIGKTAAAFVECLTSPETITICIIVALILTLSSSLEQSGQMRRLFISFRGLIINPKFNLAIFPAIIGLLPMPGGAVFSAPLVREVGGKSDFSPEQLSYINYWFRHLWEYWWPMYPGVLLATLLADIHLARFVAMMLPFTLIMAFIGWMPVDKTRLRQVGLDLSPGKKIRPFLKEIAPILFVILAGIALEWCFSAIAPGFIAAKETGLIVSLCAGNWMVWRANAMSAGQIRKIIISPHVLNMVYMMAAILLFKQVLENSGAVQAICSELIRLKIPLPLIWGMLPFIVGLLTGITIAFVGGAFPILITLNATQGQAHLMMPYVMLALVCGFSGVMLSPVHLCLLLTNDFFGTTLAPVYRLLWRPCLCLVACAFAYFALLYRVMG